MTEDTNAKVAAVAAVGRETTGDNWTKRRRVMLWSLLFIGANLQYLIVFGKPDGLRENICVAVMAAGTAIIGSYVFGAVWDDKNKRTALVATRPRRRRSRPCSAISASPAQPSWRSAWLSGGTAIIALLLLPLAVAACGGSTPSIEPPELAASAGPTKSC